MLLPIHFIFSFLLIFQIANKLANANDRLRVLVIEPNFDKDNYLASSKKLSHFAYHKRMVEILAAQDWVEKVLFFIPQLNSWEIDADLDEKAKMSGGKLCVKYAPVKLKESQQKATQEVYDQWMGSDEDEEEEGDDGNWLVDILKHESDPQVFMELAKNKELMAELRQGNFDVGIAEVWFYAAFPLLWLAGVKHIQGTSAMPAAPVFYKFMSDNYLEKIIKKGNIPEIWSTNYDSRLKIGGFREDFEKSVSNSMKAYEEMDQEFVKIYREVYGGEGEGEAPTFQKLFGQADSFLVNTQSFLEFPMPRGYPRKVAFIGGIALPRDKNTFRLQTFSSSLEALDEQERNVIGRIEKEGAGKKGLIVVSFGSLIKTENMPEEKFEAMLEAFKRLQDYEILWKFNDKEDKKRLERIEAADNVHAKSWLNQPHLLANEHTKLFISHCGMNSILETATYGIPLLCVPFFGDQHYNAETMAKRGLGVVLDIFQRGLTAAEVERKLREVLDPKKSFKRAMEVVREKMAKTDPVGLFLSKIRKFLGGKGEGKKNRRNQKKRRQTKNVEGQKH